MHLTVAACVAVARAIEVGMEETGRPLLAHKDQSIGMQLEPVFDRRLQCLQVLLKGVGGGGGGKRSAPKMLLCM